MARRRTVMTIAIDLDDSPGNMHDAESAAILIQHALNIRFMHYNPEVHATPNDDR